MFDDDRLYLAGDPALLVLGRPSTLAHWLRPAMNGPARNRAHKTGRSGA